MTNNQLLYSLLKVPLLRSQEEEEQVFVATVKALSRIQDREKHGPECMCYLPVLTVSAHIPRREG